MELGARERIITLAALTHYMSHLEAQLSSTQIDDEERADISNDAALLEILIADLTAQMKRPPEQ
jgi:hypothetical protein